MSDNAKAVVRSIVTDGRLVFYGLLLLALHVSGVLLLYRVVPEFDNVPHFWFGYVLSEYSSKAAKAVRLQSWLAAKLTKQGWTKTNPRHADFVVRLAGFLLVGGLFWEGAELAFSRYFHFRPDSFFSFPLTLSNIDGALDVTVGVIGAFLAFLLSGRRAFQKKDVG